MNKTREGRMANEEGRMKGSRRSFRRPLSTFRISRAFTIVEMIVVVGIVLILVTLIVPAATALWNERRNAEAENTIAGVLRTTRAKALQGEHGDAGLLFYLDAAGVQRIAMIAQDPNDPARTRTSTDPPSTSKPDSVDNWRTDSAWPKNIFSVQPAPILSLPLPLHAVPRYAVETELTSTGTSKPEFFSDAELANDDFNAPPTGGDQTQRHRNYFTLIYTMDGQLSVGRDVLIRDLDLDPKENPGGDLTGLSVSGKGSESKKYYGQNNQEANIFSSGPSSGWEHLVVAEGRNTALNFPPVDGLLVYDDSLFRQSGLPAQKRQYLMDAGKPFYVHRLTGAVVRGPAGENAPKTAP